MEEQDYRLVFTIIVDNVPVLEISLSYDEFADEEFGQGLCIYRRCLWNDSWVSTSTDRHELESEIDDIMNDDLCEYLFKNGCNESIVVKQNVYKPSEKKFKHNVVERIAQHILKLSKQYIE